MGTAIYEALALQDQGQIADIERFVAHGTTECLAFSGDLAALKAGYFGPRTGLVAPGLSAAVGVYLNLCEGRFDQATYEGFLDFLEIFEVTDLGEGYRAISPVLKGIARVASGLNYVNGYAACEASATR